GLVARALAGGMSYTLGPLDDWGRVPEAAYLRQRGNYVLALCREEDGRPQALFALRPRLAPDVRKLVATCQRLAIEIGLLSQGNELALRELPHRASLSLIECPSILSVIAEHQQKGELVAFVSDHAGAMAGFAACDLAIGLTDDRCHFH